MSSSRRKPPSKFAQGLTFWAIIIVVSLIVGFISFRIGRDWLGRRLTDVETADSAPRMVIEDDTAGPSSDTSAEDRQAPKEPKVAVEDRQPTEGELKKARRQAALEEPQDGAELYAEREDSDEDKDTDAESDHSTSGENVFVVTAGSYSDPANAANVISKLSGRGYKPYKEQIQKNGETYHRVNVGIAHTREEAESLRDEISAMGLPAGLIANE